jgi:hypothetical protein
VFRQPIAESLKTETDNPGGTGKTDCPCRVQITCQEKPDGSMPSVKNMQFRHFQFLFVRAELVVRWGYPDAKPGIGI